MGFEQRRMLDPRKLSQFPFLAELSVAGRFRLVSATRHETLPPFAKVIERGDEVAAAYLVEAGALRIYYVSSEGREGTLYRSRSILHYRPQLPLCSIALSSLGRDRSGRDRGRDRIRGRVPRTVPCRAFPPALHVRHSLNSALRTDDAAAGDRIVWSRTTCCSVSSKTLGKRVTFWKQHMNRSRTTLDLPAKWSQGFSAT